MTNDTEKFLSGSFDPDESAGFLKSKGLDIPALIFLRTFGLIQRPVNALFSVSTPLVGLLFGSSLANKIEDFSSNDGAWQALEEEIGRAHV